MSNPLQDYWNVRAEMDAEEFAGADVWEILTPQEKSQLIEAAKLVMRKEMALGGIV